MQRATRLFVLSFVCAMSVSVGAAPRVKEPVQPRVASAKQICRAYLMNGPVRPLDDPLRRACGDLERIRTLYPVDRST